MPLQEYDVYGYHFLLEDLLLGENTCAVWVLLYAHILINKECCSSMLLFLQMVFKIIDNKDPLLCLHSSQFPSCCTCQYWLEILHVPQSVLFYLTWTCTEFSYSVCEHKLERRLETPQLSEHLKIVTSLSSGRIIYTLSLSKLMLLTLSIFLLWSYTRSYCCLHSKSK